MTVTTELLRPDPEDEVTVERTHAERVLRRAGFAKDEVDKILGGIEFPAPLSIVLVRGERFGISTGSLVERLGGSP